jgi:hypothetical protein
MIIVDKGKKCLSLILALHCAPFEVARQWSDRGATVVWQRCDSGVAVGPQLVQPQNIRGLTVSPPPPPLQALPRRRHGSRLLQRRFIRTSWNLCIDPHQHSEFMKTNGGQDATVGLVNWGSRVGWDVADSTTVAGEGRNADPLQLISPKSLHHVKPVS